MNKNTSPDIKMSKTDKHVTLQQILKKQQLFNNWGIFGKHFLELISHW
jgi:hypothetical protein